MGRRRYRVSISKLEGVSQDLKKKKSPFYLLLEFFLIMKRPNILSQSCWIHLFQNHGLNVRTVLGKCKRDERTGGERERCLQF